MTIDRSELSVQQQVGLRIEIDSPADRMLALPKLDDVFEGWTLASSQTRESYDSLPPRRRTVLSIVLEPFLPGKKTIPALTFALQPRPGSEQRQSLSTQAIPVRVVSSLPKDAPRQDPLAPPAAKALAPMVLAQTDDQRLRWAAIGAGSACAAMLVILGIRAWIRRPRPQLTPAALALSQLARLRAELPNQPATADQRAAAAAISTNFRTVLSAHLGLNTPGHTSTELSSQLRSSLNCPDHLSTEAGSILRELDALTFSGSNASLPNLASLADRAESVARLLTSPSEVRP